MDERWKAVLGYEGRYEVSDLGRVRSLPRVSVKRTKDGTRSVTVTGGMMQTPIAADGYPVARLTKDGVGKSFKVHRLVLLAFEGPPPPDKPYALHRNGVRAEARLSGLYWGSPKENQDDRVVHGTSNRGERNGHVTLSESQVRSLKEQLINRKRGDIAKMSRATGIKYQTVRDIAAGATWSHL